MTGLVVALDGRGVELDDVGGKAWALDRLAAHGFPVPPARALTTDAYRRFVRHAGLDQLVADLAHGPLPEPADMDDATREVDQAFLHGDVADGLRDSIERAAAEVAGGGRLAVRSSATVEDARSASYAGQFRSLLDVDTADVLDAVRLAWASLWWPGARAYHQAQGRGADDLAMGVVLMPMVPARHAGVLFTVDPGGRPDHLRVEVVEGLGEGLVSGEVTPDAHVVPRRPPRRIPGDLAAVLDELCDLALDVEDAMGGPQDIEWAHDGERLVLLQTRPITTEPGALPGPAGAGSDDDGFDTPLRPAWTYTSAGVGEMLPGVLPPLLWSLNGTALEEAFRRLFSDLGALPDGLVEPFALVARVRGRAALNLDLLRRVAAQMPGGSAAELERQYFGAVISEGDVDDDADDGRSAGRLAGLVTMARAARLRRRFREEAAVVGEAVDCLVELAPRLHDLPRQWLVAYLHALTDLGARAVAAEAAVAASAAAAYRGLELFLERLVGEEAGELAQRLTAGRVDVSKATAATVTELVAAAAGDPELAGALDDDGDEAEARARLAESTAGRLFLQRLDVAAARAGSASVFGGRTWDEAGLTWRLVRQARRRLDSDRRSEVGDADEELARLERRLTRTWRWRLTRLVTGQVVDVRRRMLRRLVDDAADLLREREEAKAAVLRLGGEVRRVVRLAASRLARRGLLDDPDHVELLSIHELEQALAGGGAPPAAELDRRGQALEAARAAGPLPRRFRGRPGPVEAEATEGDELHGWGASPGRHRGRARVVDDLRTADLHDGEVLVAQATDPSWTPLFLTAGAVVVEEGGPLSHAAIVARELGIPAVLNVPGAVARLRDADDVTVDGSGGAVHVHDGDGFAGGTDPDDRAGALSGGEAA